MSGPTRPPAGAFGSPAGAPLSRKVVVEFWGWSSAVPALPSRPSASSAVPSMPSGPQSLRRRRGRCRRSRPLDRLVTDQGAAAVLVAHLPVGGVGAEGGDVDAGVAGRLEAVELALGPVLGVAGDRQRFVVEQLRRVLVDRDVVGVGDVVALLLEPRDHCEVGLRRSSRGPSLLSNSGRSKETLTARPVPETVSAAAELVVVERLAAPGVVGLVGRRWGGRRGSSSRSTRLSSRTTKTIRFSSAVPPTVVSLAT